MSQGVLAGHVGVNRVSITNWENDDHSPDRDNAIKLASFFRVKLNWLIHGKGQKYDLSHNQQRIADAMQSKHMDTLGLAAATGGQVACETIDLWLTAWQEPTEAEIKLVERPLGIGQPAVSESRCIGLIYDTRGDPEPRNLDELEIDVVRWMREMGTDRRNSLHDTAQSLANMTRTDNAAISKSKRA